MTLRSFTLFLAASMTLSPAAALGRTDLNRLLADSASPFWECKGLALEHNLAEQPSWRYPVWNVLRHRFPHAFSERARKEVKPDQVLIAHNPLVLTDTLLHEQLDQLTPLLPDKVRDIRDATLKVAALRRGLQDLGYSSDDTAQLAGYTHPSFGFIGYVLLTEDPIFAPCLPTGITDIPQIARQAASEERIIDASSKLIYLGFLPKGQQPRLVKVIDNGWRVQDALSGRMYRLLDSEGKPITLQKAGVRAQPNSTLPLVLDVYLQEVPA